MKKSLYVLSAAVLALGVGAATIAATSPFAATSTDVAPVIEAEYEYNSTLDIPTYEKDGVTFQSVLVYPDGKATKSTKAALTQVGTYSLHYTGVVKGKYESLDYRFVVKNQTYLFSGTRSSASYERSERTYDKEGLYVSLAQGETMTFTQPLDVSSVSKGDTLFRFFAAPEKAKQIDFGELDLRFTDVADSSVFLCMRFKTSIDGVSHPFTYMDAAGNGQDFVGLEPHSPSPIIHTNSAYGTPTTHSFYGNYDGYAPSAGRPAGYYACSVSYDVSENALYSNDGVTYICDFDNSKHFSKLWGGFKSGQVTLSVTAGNYTGEMANFLVSTVRGMDLSEKVIEDYAAPKISIDCPYDILPDAVVGEHYPVFKATAMDEMSGETPVKASVAYNKGSDWYDVSVENGYFETKRPGLYRILYESVDAVGNLANETLYVSTSDSIAPLNVVPRGSVNKEIKKGVKYVLPEFRISGGSGNVETSYEVTHGGADVAIIDGSFTPLDLGKYTVTFKAKDITLKEKTYSYDVLCIYNEGAVFVDAPKLPKYYLSGYSYELPKVMAIDYGNGGKEIVSEVTYNVKGTETTVPSGSRFVPDVDNHLDSIELVYKAKDSELRYSVPVVKSKEGRDVQIQNYFITNNVSLNTTDFGAKTLFVAQNQGDASWEFANPLANEKLTLKLRNEKGAATYSALRFLLVDQYDENETLTIELLRGSNGKINVRIGEDVMRTDIGFNDAVGYSLVLRNGVISIEGMEMPVAKFDDGRPYVGFSSGKVYLTATMVSAKKDSAFYLEKIGNQTICDMLDDDIAPMIVSLDNFGGYVGINQLVSSCRVLVSDILDPVADAVVSVYNPERKIVKDVQGETLLEVNPAEPHTILLEQYGSYSFRYVAMDSRGNEANFSYSVGVMDDIAPEIHITSGYATKISVNENIVIPTYEVTDNYDEEVPSYVTITSPTGKLYTLPKESNSLKAIHQGVYRVNIVAIDAAGNYASFGYDVVVE